MSRRPGTLAAVVLLACLPLAACGGDDEGEPTRSPNRPELTVPGGAGTDPATTTETTPAPAPPPVQTAPSTTPQGTTPDSPQNDVPPPAGSPAERFEKFCDENPGACG